MTNLIIQTNVNITDENIDDIMVGALEGGITYWCSECRVVDKYLGKYASEQISRGGQLVFVVPDDDKGEYVMNKSHFLKGLQMFLEQHPECIVDGELDTCLIDGMYADCIIQYALFGELVFG